MPSAELCWDVLQPLGRAVEKGDLWLNVQLTLRQSGRALVYVGSLSGLRFCKCSRMAGQKQGGKAPVGWEQMVAVTQGMVFVFFFFPYETAWIDLLEILAPPLDLVPLGFYCGI